LHEIIPKKVEMTEYSFIDSDDSGDDCAKTLNEDNLIYNTHTECMSDKDLEEERSDEQKNKIPEDQNDVEETKQEEKQQDQEEQIEHEKNHEELKEDSDKSAGCNIGREEAMDEDVVKNFFMEVKSEYDSE
jgi:hypothetical protein